MANPNHPNRPQQQNRPQQPQQQPRPVAQPVQPQAPVAPPVAPPTPSAPVENVSVPAVASVVETHSDSTVAPLAFAIEPEELEIAVAEATTFEQLLSSLIDDMIAHRISAQDSKKVIHSWLMANPDFTRQDAEETLATLRGAVETVVQEIPRMLSR